MQIMLFLLVCVCSLVVFLLCCNLTYRTVIRIVMWSRESWIRVYVAVVIIICAIPWTFNETVNFQSFKIQDFYTNSREPIFYVTLFCCVDEKQFNKLTTQPTRYCPSTVNSIKNKQQQQQQLNHTNETRTFEMYTVC